MATPVKMPRLGESVVEGTVLRWLKGVGDPVQKLEPLLEVSTDKIDTEVPAPADGTLVQILVAEGATVDAGTVIAYIGRSGEDLPSHDDSRRAQEPVAEGEAMAVEPSATGRAASSRPVGRSFVSPVVARMAAEHRVDVDQIAGTGMGGRVTRKDMVAYLQGARTVGRDRAASPPGAAPPQPPGPGGADPAVSVTPLSTMRRTIAAHMVQSKETSPHVTTLFEVDMGRVVLHREAHQAAMAAKGVRLTFTPYFVAAAAQALKAVPEVNGRFTPDGIVMNHGIHIGVAVALEDGLLVPVIRDADERNLQGLARAVTDLAQQARRGALTPDHLAGGTFTVTNHGVGGSLAGTPIIHQPQSAILGVGAIQKRPVVRSRGHPLLPSADDAILIRPMCYLSLSFDHRVLDGAKADLFLTRIKATLENWE